ncbi:hypothetical protein D3C80_2197230 [compost metagenome]
MRCRMKDYMRSVTFEYFQHPGAILYISNNRYNIQLRKALAKLHFNCVNAVLSMSEDQQLVW